MPERPADVRAGERNFVKKIDLDDAGHDTRVVTTLGVADDEDWFAKGTSSPPTSIGWRAATSLSQIFVTNISLRPPLIRFPRPPRENLLTKRMRETMHRLPGA